jgi:hypothetical protein
MDHSPMSNKFQEEVRSSKKGMIATVLGAVAVGFVAGYAVAHNNHSVEPMFAPSAFGRGHSATSLNARVEPDTEYSTALPFSTRPSYLDGTLLGDQGFDPFRLGKARVQDQDEKLFEYREAEIKHGRLAMVASFGPLLDKLSTLINSVKGVDAVPVDDEKLKIFYAGAFAAAVVGNEMDGIMYREEQGGSVYPGDNGWDPLKLFVDADEDERDELQLKELKNGRLAMVAIVINAWNDAINSNPGLKDFFTISDKVWSDEAFGNINPNFTPEGRR